MKIKNIFGIVLVFSYNMVQAEIYGIQQAQAVFTQEISCVLDFYAAVEKRGNFSPIIETPAVAFLHKNSDALARETDLFFDVVQRMYENAGAIAAIRAINIAIDDFLRDPLLMQTRSGKEIIMLESYQRVKKAIKICQKIERTFYKPVLAKMALLGPILVHCNKYIDELFFNKIEQALTCIYWDDTLGNNMNDLCCSRPDFAEFLSQGYSIMRYVLSDKYIAKIIETHEAKKQILKAFFRCCGSVNILRILHSFPILLTIQDQKASVDSLKSLMADSDFRDLLKAIEALEETEPVITFE